MEKDKYQFGIMIIGKFSLRIQNITILFGQNVYKVEIKNTVDNRLANPVLLFAINKDKRTIYVNNNNIRFKVEKEAFIT